MSRLQLEHGSKTQRAGVRGETIALWYLRFHGYRLLERNYLVGHKEIDLIMKRKNTVVFVEVKTRNRADSRIPAQMSVDRRKQRNIIAASKTYALRKGLNKVVLRNDIVEVTLKGLKVNHIINAF